LPDSEDKNGDVEFARQNFAGSGDLGHFDLAVVGVGADSGSAAVGRSRRWRAPGRPGGVAGVGLGPL